MKNSRFILALLVALTAFLLWKLMPSFNKTQNPSADGKLRVAATISPIADIVRNVGGQFVDVQTVMPPGASPHTFEPTPQDVLNLQDTVTFFAVGHGLDNWISPLTTDIPGSSVVTVDHGLALLSPVADADEPAMDADPHYWLSIPNAQVIAVVIADELKRLDPPHYTEYENNLEKYLKQLKQADGYVRGKISGVRNKNIVTHHNAWRYFAGEYGLTVVGTFETNPGQEPTAKDLADLQETVSRYGIATLFSEPQLSEQALRPFIQDLRLDVAVLDPEGGTEDMGYIDMMKYNADTVANAK